MRLSATEETAPNREPGERNRRPAREKVRSSGEPTSATSEAHTPTLARRREQAEREPRRRLRPGVHDRVPQWPSDTRPRPAPGCETAPHPGHHQQRQREQRGGPPARPPPKKPPAP